MARASHPRHRRLAMLFDGVKLLFTNWRLTLVQVLPAMWIWAAMYDLKLHLSPWHDKAFHVRASHRAGDGLA
jgi:hypothetical protein